MGRTGGATARRQPGTLIRVCCKRVHYRSCCRTPLYYRTPRFDAPWVGPAAARRGHASCRNMRMRFHIRRACTDTAHSSSGSCTMHAHVAYLYICMYNYAYICVCVRACLRACVRARVCVRVLPNGCRCRGWGVRAGLRRPARRCCSTPPLSSPSSVWGGGLGGQQCPP